MSEKAFISPAVVQRGPWVRAGVWLLGIAIWMLAVGPAPAPADVQDLDLSYRNGRITVKSAGAPLERILETIAAAAHIRIHVMEAAAARGSVNLVEEPLEQALRVLLRGASYAVVYDDEAPTLLTYGQGIRNLPGPGTAGGATGTRRAMAHGSSGRSGDLSGNRKDAAGTRDRSNGPAGKASFPTGGMGDRYACGVAGTDLTEGSSTGQGESDSETGLPPDSTATATEVPPQVESLIRQRASNTEIDDYCQQRIADLEARIASGLSDFNYNHFVRLKGEQFVTHDRKLLEMYQNYVSNL